MAGERVRWRNVREFLDDLPEVHCTAKPPHEFCTVCMRINYIVANDCPLYHVKPKRKLVPVLGEEDEPIKDHVTSEDVRKALTGEDYPIIEFARERGTHPSEAAETEVPIEVEPMEEPKPAPPKKGAKATEAPKAKTEASEAKTATETEDLLDHIMQSIEIPSEKEAEKIAKEIEEELESKPEAAEEPEGKAPEEKEEPRAKEVPKKKKPRTKKKGDGTPPVVEKRVVTTRVKKGE